MKKILLAAFLLAGVSANVSAQKTVVEVSKVVNAEIDFNKLVERKGIKAGFLAVADPEGIVFKPNAVKISEFYGTIDKMPGKLTWQPKVARISANGDLAFTAGPYVYQNGKTDDDKVYGQYLSVWKRDAADNKLKLLIDLGIQHPEPEAETGTDFREPDTSKQVAPSKDPFSGKTVIINSDKAVKPFFRPIGTGSI
jgi:ketosteroid isomerase-like protein